MRRTTTSSIGCGNTLGSSFGLTPPQYKLLPDAKAFRNGSLPTAPRELAKTLHPPHIVEPGDVLLVQPVELDSPFRISADQPVLPDGTIDLSPYGRPVVAGRTLPSIETEVQNLIRKQSKEEGKITVRLVGRHSKVFYVLGEVNAPGAFPITGRETVLDAILIAGGLTRHASEKNILISRPSPAEGCRTVMPVCYSQIVQLGDTSTNYQVFAGDRIYVSSKSLSEDLCNKKSSSPCQGTQVPCSPDGCPIPVEVSPHTPATPAAVLRAPVAITSPKAGK